jgi:2-keto-3-deoxy-6-phosphogluconate aldolase
MPRTPKGHKRPADVISNAVHVMRIATGEIDETMTEDGKNAAAVALGRKGGLARAKSIEKTARVKIAKNAAKARWKRSNRRR